MYVLRKILSKEIKNKERFSNIINLKTLTNKNINKRVLSLHTYMKYKDKLRTKFDNECQNNLSFMRFVTLKYKLF